MTIQVGFMSGGDGGEGRMKHPLWQKIHDRWLQEYRWPSLRVLDLGCRTGESTELIADRGAKFVLGVDASQKLIQLARQKSQHMLNVNYLIADPMHTRLRQTLCHYCGSQPFSVALAIMSLECASTMSELMTFLRNMSQSLTERGTFIALLLDPDNPISDFRAGCLFSTRWLDDAFAEGARIEKTVYDANSGPIYTMTNYYWEMRVYHDLLRKYGFQYIRWVKDDVLADIPLTMVLAAK